MNLYIKKTTKGIIFILKDKIIRDKYSIVKVKKMMFFQKNQSNIIIRLTFRDRKLK